ncbi:MAG TPA: DNA polymerase III subunit gamma/tau [Polyangiaceae bacterium]|nr:DNA polymerase III subunit gamma/tau [Polyangiaceae bacterium]
MSYVVLARKWRPQSFADLVGQEHVSRTLQNAIAADRVAHAFLFTGVRGVGKTTSARILAKALNCLTVKAALEASSKGGEIPVEPCLKCAACQEITQGVDLDVQEVDGASYTGVDDIRRLQSSLQHRPARDRFRIFIVDEVHMLSSSAWNAFLKTLEEPPPHVKFILATTEVHKVPVTILSRVQRFDFRMIPLSTIVERLRYVLKQENIEAEDAALAILGREAAGSMRDAMSLLDQVLAYDAKQLRAEAVSKVLGVASHEVLYSLTKDLLAGNAESCLRKVGEIADQGFNLTTVSRDLLGLLRNLVVSKVCEKPDDLLDLPDDERRDVVEVAAAASADDLIRLHQGFSRGFDDVVRSGQPRAALEMLLIRLARRPALIPVEDWVARLGALEQRLSKGAPSPGAQSSGSPGPGPQGPGPQGRGSAPAGGNRANASTSPSQVAAPPTAPTAPPPPKMAPAPAQPAPSTIKTAPAQPAASPPAGQSGAVKTAPTPAAASSVAAVQSVANGQAATPKSNGSHASSENLQRWRELLDTLRSERPEVVAMLQHVVPLTLTAEQVTLGIERGNVFEAPLNAADVKRWLERGAAQHLGGNPRLQLRTLDSLAGEQTLASMAADARSERKQAATDRAKQHPKVLEAIEILGGRIKEVRAGED